MTDDPALPAGLQLLRLGDASSARSACIEHARGGAAEGTLVWVEHPSQPRGRDGRAWQEGPTPGLHAALLLRPGLPAAECAQLGPVASVALARAIADQVQPMTELHYRWPNDVLLDGGKVAGVWLDAAGAPERLDWLVVGWAINTRTAPASLGFDAAALEREGQSGVIDHAALLQAIARQLVAAITTWDEAGFEPLLRSWRGRLALGGPIRVAGAGEAAVAGTAESVDDAGALTVRADTATHEVTLRRFFGLPRDG